VIASAAHVSPRTAVQRTVTEAALNWFITSKKPCDADISEWLETAVLGQHPHLQPWGLTTLPPESPPISTEAQVEYLTSRLAVAGLRPVAIDLTRRDTLLNTVRIIVPGLRTFKPGYSTGRLYDVPVLLGWRSDRLPESELNPWCVF
jgi:ribosomal protein S12 methylthiotransferase accessory factor